MLQTSATIHSTNIFCAFLTRAAHSLISARCNIKTATQGTKCWVFLRLRAFRSYPGRRRLGRLGWRMIGAIVAHGSAWTHTITLAIVAHGFAWTRAIILAIAALLAPRHGAE